MLYKLASLLPHRKPLHSLKSRKAVLETTKRSHSLAHFVYLGAAFCEGHGFYSYAAGGLFVTALVAHLLGETEGEG